MGNREQHDPYFLEVRIHFELLTRHIGEPADLLLRTMFDPTPVRLVLSEAFSAAPFRRRSWIIGARFKRGKRSKFRKAVLAISKFEIEFELDQGRPAVADV